MCYDARRLSSVLASLRTRPSVTYRRDPNAYWRYDARWLVASATFSAGLWLSGWRGLSTPLWMGLAALPLLVWAHVAANATVHNCCHQNLPRPINRLVAEVLGLFVIVRFFVWEVMHTRHHAFPDDPERDPHPCKPTFVQFMVGIMLVTAEKQLHAIKRERHPDHMKYEGVRTVFSLVTDASILIMWFVLLGWPLFLGVFIPMQILGWVILGHFNWIAHRGADRTADFGPRNRDHGLFWLGNRIWFGIYMHKNHHDYAGRFNPLPPERRLFGTPHTQKPRIESRSDSHDREGLRP